MWRRLKLHGAVALHGSGYLLPWSQANLEHFEWLAAAIRRYEGEATVARVRGFDSGSAEGLEQLFLAARQRDYEALIEQLEGLDAAPRGRGAAGRAARARQRLEQIESIDFSATHSASAPERCSGASRRWVGAGGRPRAPNHHSIVPATRIVDG